MTNRPASVWRRTPLWLRLMTTVLALAALALTVTGIFGARLLRGYLVERVDDELLAAAETVARLSRDPRLLEGGLPLPSQFHFQLQDQNGAPVRSQPANPSDASPPDLPSMTPSEVRERGLDPMTVPAEDGHGSWRSIALPTVDGGSFLIARSLHEVDDTVDRLVTIDWIVGGAVLVGLALAGYSMVRTAMRPLTKIEQTAAAIAGGDMSRRVSDDDPRTEVGRLGRALNAMLEQIETAFHERQVSEEAALQSEERMRRFVADASHELRTPLTSIRGFAELHRQGAVTAPDEVSRLVGSIESEATRMGLLVDDLLLLARLDQQRPFERAPVDLRLLAADTVEAARAAAPGRDLRLDVTPDDAPDELVVAGDEPRLRQVLTNLLDNALAYSPAASPVTVLVGRTVRDGAEVGFVEVRDRGPGLTPDQAERVFERFYRTDKARSRAHGGAGLGLSIVAAITAAHGGTVELDTIAGEGATFRVLLPLVANRPAPAPTTTAAVSERAPVVAYTDPVRDRTSPLGDT